MLIVPHHPLHTVSLSSSVYTAYISRDCQESTLVYCSLQRGGGDILFWRGFAEETISRDKQTF